MLNQILTRLLDVAILIYFGHQAWTRRNEIAELLLDNYSDHFEATMTLFYLAVMVGALLKTWERW